MFHKTFQFIAKIAKNKQQWKNYLVSKRLPIMMGTTLALTASLSHIAMADCKDGQCQKNKHHKEYRSEFYPEITPFNEGHLQVDDIHAVYYAQYGNPDGVPVLFVHGGPGGGTDPAMARYFDPKHYRIVLVDQRGCGNSTPFGELENNTTFELVNDFEKIRKHLHVPSWGVVFGGSWGSTLSLTYATEHPDKVQKLILRGIFLIRKKEIDWFYEGKGANYIFPEDWSIYENAIPGEERHNFIAAYHKRLTGELGHEEMIKAARAWAQWEGRTSKLVQDSWDNVNSKFDDKFSYAFARIENHYFINRAFFPRDEYLLEPRQIDKIKHIPTIIVQGRYDVVCPAISAYELKQKLPHADLRITLTGHSGFEPEIARELVKAAEQYKE